MKMISRRRFLASVAAVPVAVKLAPLGESAVPGGSPTLQIGRGVCSGIQMHHQPAAGELIQLIYDGNNWVHVTGDPRPPGQTDWARLNAAMHRVSRVKVQR